jgi:hypothetical protein
VTVERTALFDVAGAGGGGGYPFTSACPAGYVMTGLSLRTGWYVDAVRIVCTQVNANGTWKTHGDILRPSPFYDYLGGHFGGMGGSAVNLMCDRDWGVESLTGSSGALVDSLGIRCGRLGPTVTGGRVRIVGTERRTRGPAGGSGGSPFLLRCYLGEAVTAISGRAGVFVDQIGRSCGMTTPTQ